MRLCSTSLFNKDTFKQEQIFNVAIRLFVCCSLAVCSTIFGIIVILISMNIPGYNWPLFLVLSITQIDHVVNSLCLMFTWPFFIKYYKKCIICKICHKLVEKNLHKDTFVRSDNDPKPAIIPETPVTPVTPDSCQSPQSIETS